MLDEHINKYFEEDHKSELDRSRLILLIPELRIAVTLTCDMEVGDLPLDGKVVLVTGGGSGQLIL